MKRVEPASGPVHAFAPAKVNLTLEVLGRRPDGYHEVRTAMLALELADRLTLERNERGAVALSVAGPHASAEVPRDAENLAVRAAQAVLEAARLCGVVGDSAGVAIDLEKRIPSQAGLGGASADAAAAALATARVLGLACEPDELDALLAALGSDCVFFARAAETGFAWCEGRGERVMPVPAPFASAFVAVLTPEVTSPTHLVYSALGDPLSETRELHTLPSAWFDMPVSQARLFFFNRLEAVALETVPSLRSWRRALDACGAEHFRLSGSGSSFFGLFESAREAEQALERVDDEMRARGLVARGRWVTRPSCRGASLDS